MRTLVRNKTTLWYCEPNSITELKDSDGNYTGEIQQNYTEPIKIRINIYPSNGGVTEDVFGKNYSCDMFAVSNDINLNEKTLLFLQIPVAPYQDNYDYSVANKKESINTFNYGLRKRV